MEALERDLKAIDQSYGENMLNLTCALGYVKRLLENAKVTKILKAIEKIDIDAESGIIVTIKKPLKKAPKNSGFKTHLIKCNIKM